MKIKNAPPLRDAGSEFIHDILGFAMFQQILQYSNGYAPYAKTGTTYDIAAVLPDR